MGIKKVKSALSTIQDSKKTQKEIAQEGGKIDLIAGTEEEGFFLMEAPMEVPLRGNKVLLEVPVTSESVNSTIKRMKEAALYTYKLSVEHPEVKLPVELWIDSPGGSVIQGWRLIDFIETAPFDVITVGNGIVASMAFCIFISGKKRRATKNTFFLIHQLRGGIPGPVKYKEVYEQLKVWDFSHERMVQHIVANTRLTEEKVRELLDSETWIDTRQAYEWGIVDEIIGENAPPEAPPTAPTTPQGPPPNYNTEGVNV